MNQKLALLALFGVACGEVVAEPIVMEERELAVTSVDEPPADSSDPYACDVVATARDIDQTSQSVVPFLSSSTLDYRGQCAGGDDAGAQCWYTGPGFFLGGVDAETGAPTLAGGQHMVCTALCTADDQCPAPASGTAQPFCMHSPEFDPETEGGSCNLGCGSGETCPDDFVCANPSLGFGLSDGTISPAPPVCLQYKPLVVLAPLP